jgi:hypothetical protein
VRLHTSIKATPPSSSPPKAPTNKASGTTPSPATAEPKPTLSSPASPPSGDSLTSPVSPPLPKLSTLPSSELHLTPEPPTVPVPALDLLEYVRAQRDSISSKHNPDTCFRKYKRLSTIVVSGGYNVPLDVNPFNSWARVLDCGDIPVTSYVYFSILSIKPFLRS